MSDNKSQHGGYLIVERVENGWIFEGAREYRTPGKKWVASHRERDRVFMEITEEKGEGDDTV